MDVFFLHIQGSGLLALDNGSAIKGQLLGHVFWGSGDYAVNIAGKMKSRRVTWVLLPKEGLER